MTTESGDTSDEEYLYGKEGQTISTPPLVPAPEDSAPLSAEMAVLEVNEESFGMKIDEMPTVDTERSASDQEAVPVLSNESFKSPEPSTKAEAASLSPDNRVSVVQQSPPAAPVTNEASGNESSEDDEDANDSSDDGIRITIGEGNIISTSAAIPQQTPFSRSFGDGGQASKQLDVSTVGNVNGVSLYDLDMETSFDEKPWRKPGADITDYFNYGFTEDTWKTYCLKQKQLRQDYKPQPILEDSVTNNEIVVLGEKPMPLKKELIMPHEFEGFAPPVFHPLLMPPPVMPHLGGMLPPVCTVPQLDPLGLGPPPLHLPPNVLPPFQPDPGRDHMMHPPFPPHAGFRDPSIFPDHLYPDFLHEFANFEQREFKSMSPRRRTSLESLSDYSFSSEDSQGRHQRPGRDYRDSKRDRRRHSPRERHRPHRDGRDRERERERGRDKERDRDRDREREREREREKDHRMHERPRHRDKEIEADKHAHQERARDREARERVVRRLGVRGGEGAGAREQRGRHERKKHREPVNHDGSPRKRAKRTRHGTDAKSPSLL